ncbi:MAG: ABC transporter permease, partial [Chitinophagales bacterium]
MKFRDITFRYLKGQKRRSILTIVGIILSVALISGMGTMMVGLREYQIGKTAENNGDYYAQYNGVKGTLVNGITSSKGISRAAVTSEEGCVILTRLSNQERAGDPKIPPCRYVYLTACDSESFSLFSLRPEQGRAPASPGELMLDYGAWEQMPSRPQLGEKVKLEVGFWYSGYNRVPNEDYSWNGKEVFRKKAESEYTLVGLSRARIQTSRNYVTSGFVFLDRQALAANQSYDVFIKTASVINATGQAEAIAQKVGLKKFQKLNGTWSYPITYNDSLLRISAQSSDGTVNNGLTKMVGFIALLVMLCTVAVIYNAFNISVMERISQFGLMRCVGTTPGQIRKIVFQEAAIMSLVGIPVGLACGVLAMKVVMLLIG